MVSKKIERLRSDLAMAMLRELENQGKISGDVMHCGGTLGVTAQGIGTIRIVVEVKPR